MKMEDTSSDTLKTCSPSSSEASEASEAPIDVSIDFSSQSSDTGAFTATLLGTPSIVWSTISKRRKSRSRSASKKHTHHSRDKLGHFLTSPPAMNPAPQFCSGYPSKQWEKKSRRLRWRRRVRQSDSEDAACDADIDESSEVSCEERLSPVLSLRVLNDSPFTHENTSQESQQYKQHDCSPLLCKKDGRMDSSLSSSSSSLDLSKKIDRQTNTSPVNNIRFRQASFGVDTEMEYIPQSHLLSPLVFPKWQQSAIAFFRRLMCLFSILLKVISTIIDQIGAMVSTTCVYKGERVEVKRIHLVKLMAFITLYSLSMFIIFVNKIPRIPIMETSSHRYVHLRLQSSNQNVLEFDRQREDFGPIEIASAIVLVDRPFISMSEGTDGSSTISRRSLGGVNKFRTSTQRHKQFNVVKWERRGVSNLDINLYSDRSYMPGDKQTFSRLLAIHRDMDKESLKRPRRRKLEIDQTPFSDNSQLYGLRSSDDEALSRMEIFRRIEEGECRSELWQTLYRPSCNNMHEIDLRFTSDNLNSAKVNLFQDKGFWRNAWRFDTPSYSGGGDMDSFILKTPRYEHNFEHAHYEHDRVDALAMEHLTFSPHVVDIFSFCGRSVITEFANGPKFGTLIDKSKKRKFKRLEIASDVASGLADVHFGKNNTLQFVHFDINPANIVVVDGRPKINDFNIASMLKRNSTSGERCKVSAHEYPNAQWRSPEEVNQNDDLTERVDVFSLGHILFRILSSHEPWNKFEIGGRPSADRLARNVGAGIMPRIPRNVMNSKDPEVNVIREAMLKCYTLDPKSRPSSREVAIFLKESLNELQNEGLKI